MYIYNQLMKISEGKIEKILKSPYTLFQNPLQYAQSITFIPRPKYLIPTNFRHR